MCTDMRGFGHSNALVPNLSGVGLNRELAPIKAGCAIRFDTKTCTERYVGVATV
jgi:hypothetical protein